ncbi:MAG: tape measure protein, partial [Arachnia propionica]
SAAADVEAAEAALNRARSSGTASASNVASAEAADARALNASKAANSAADAAAASHSRTLGQETQATREADAAADALAASTGKTKREVVATEPSLHSLAKALDDVDDSADEVSRSVGDSGARVSSVGSLARSAVAPVLALGAAVGIGGFASEAIEASDATDKFVSTLQFAGIDTTTIDRLKESAQKYADETVYDLSDIQNVTAQLAANGVENYDKLAEAAGNLNAVAGGNKETFSSVGMVLTQTAGQGKLTTENFNQLSDAIPGASGKIQEALLNAGAYTGNFREALEKGEVTAQEFNDAVLQLGSDETAQAAARSTKTIEGAAGNLQATIVGGFKDLIDYIKPGVTDLMGSITDSISSSIDWIKGHKDEMLALGVAVGVAVAAYAGFSILTSVKAWIASTTLAQQGLNAALRANPVGIVITALAALAAGLYLLYQRNEGFRLKVQELGKTVVSVWQEWIWPAISAVWDWISGTLLPGIQSVWNILAHGDFDGNLFGLEEDSGFVTFLFTVRDAAAATWEWITGTLAPAVQEFWTGTLQPILAAVGDAVSTAWSGYIYPALSALWGFITGSLAPAVQEFWTGTVQPVFSTIGTFIATVWNGAILPALSALWGFITGTLGPAISGFWTGIVQPAFSAIGSIISTAWTQYISPALSALWSFVTGVLMPMVSTLWGVIQPIITAIGNLIVSAWSNVIQPALSALWSFISGVLGPVFMWLWNSVVQPAFQTIGNIISMVWNGVVSPIFSAMVAVVRDVLGPIFMWLWNNVISPVWGWISDKISGVVNFVADTVFPRIKTAIDTAKTGFDNFKTGVETAMNGIKKAAATPVNFVINTVYRDGIKKAFDTIAEKVGLSLRLPTVSPIAGYASGGRWRTMLPGYTPGKDVYHFFSPDGG